MAPRRKSWKEKLKGPKDLPKIERIPPRLRKKYGDGTMVIPSPTEVKEFMGMVPKGMVVTVKEICEGIAKRHSTNICCPLTTGIFVWIVANAAEEDLRNGQKNVTPYWRTLKTGGYLNPKYPGGVERHKHLLESEGHEIVEKKGKLMVKGYEDVLMKF